MMEVYSIYIIGTVVMVLLSALFSGTETALVSANPVRLTSMAEHGNRAARKVLPLLSNMEDAMGMVLIGNNIANIAATAFITYVATRAFMLQETALFAVTAVQTMLFLLFSEVSPKIIARSRPETFLMTLHIPLRIFNVLFRPLVFLSLFFSTQLKKNFSIPDDTNKYVRSRDEIDIFFQLGHEEGILEHEHSRLVSELLSFRDITASEVMTPTVEITSLQNTAKVSSLVRLIEKTRFSRIPIYEERVDNITGYVFYRDLIQHPDAREVRELCTPAVYVPETGNVYELYREMTRKKHPVVFVVNEYGAVTGMITYEDIAEELVGEIETRDHREEAMIEQLSPRRYILNGRLNIDYLTRYFPIAIEKKGFETVAGFLSYQLGRVPSRGDRLEYEGYRFIVDESTDRAVVKVRLLLPLLKN